MKFLKIKKVAVIGAGGMGHSIAEVVAMAGYEVNIMDSKQKTVDEAIEKIRKSLGMLAEMGTISKDVPDQSMKRIHKLPSLEEAVKDVDFVIEAVPEKMNIKKDVFASLDKAAPDHTILASNSSSLNISEMAEATKRPEKCLGFHFVHPPQNVEFFPPIILMMPLVEIIYGEKTSKETINVAHEFAKSIGKHPVVEEWTPAFIVDKVLARAGIELSYILEREGAKPEEIDAALKFGPMGMILGPCEIVDMIGVDVAVDVLEYLERVLGESYKPSPFFSRMVKEGKLGMKTRKGLYDYSKGPPQIREEDAGKFDSMRLITPLVNEVGKLIEEFADPKKIDECLKFSIFPDGLAFADKLGGLDIMVKKLEELNKKYNTRRYEPTKLIKRLARENRKLVDLV